MQPVDVTLVGISNEFTSDGGPVEISGALFAKTFTRARIEMESKALFVSDTPVKIAVGGMLAIGATVTVTVSTDTSEIAVVGENLGLGGQLGTGGPRHLIIPIIARPYAEDKHSLRFMSDDGAQLVRADFSVKRGNAPPI
jgi:hypothetical protein